MAFHPSVSSTLPFAGDGCLHMEPRGHRLWDSREQHPAVWTGGDSGFVIARGGTFCHLSGPETAELLQRICEQIQSVPSSPVRSFLISEAWAMGFLGDHTQQLTEATVASCLSGSPDLPERQGMSEGGEGVSVCPAGVG